MIYHVLLVLVPFLVVKINQLLQLGLSMLLNVKMEWAFKFKFWPLDLAVKLDLLQLSCFLFFTYDAFFSAYASYLKKIAANSTKIEQAGCLGKMFAQTIRISPDK